MNYAYVNFLHLFILKRFGAPSPMPPEFKPVKPWMVDGVEKVKTSHLKRRGLRWYRVTWLEESTKPLSKIIDKEQIYNFRPYAYTLRGVVPNFFDTHSSGVVSLEPRSRRLRFSFSWV